MPEQMTKQDAIEYLLYMKHDVQAKSPMDIALDTAIEALNQPTIEAEPVRRGWWIYRFTVLGERLYECSCCAESKNENSYMADEEQIKKFVLCPVCGARMDATDTNVGGKGGADNG